MRSALGTRPARNVTANDLGECSDDIILAVEMKQIGLPKPLLKPLANVLAVELEALRLAAE